jgi:hypothetical protein
VRGQIFVVEEEKCGGVKMAPQKFQSSQTKQTNKTPNPPPLLPPHSPHPKKTLFFFFLSFHFAIRRPTLFELFAFVENKAKM